VRKRKLFADLSIRWVVVNYCCFFVGDAVRKGAWTTPSSLAVVRNEGVREATSVRFC